MLSASYECIEGSEFQIQIRSLCRLNRSVQRTRERENAIERRKHSSDVSIPFRTQFIKFLYSSHLLQVFTEIKLRFSFCDIGFINAAKADLVDFTVTQDLVDRYFYIALFPIRLCPYSRMPIVRFYDRLLNSCGFFFLNFLKIYITRETRDLISNINTIHNPFLLNEKIFTLHLKNISYAIIQAFYSLQIYTEKNNCEYKNRIN